jgi:hypothetical protein
MGGGTLGGNDDEDDEDGVRYNGLYMRFFQLDKTNSFNNLFTKMSNPEHFFDLVVKKLGELEVFSKSTRAENEWLWNLTIAKD